MVMAPTNVVIEGNDDSYDEKAGLLVDVMMKMERG